MKSIAIQSLWKFKNMAMSYGLKSISRTITTYVLMLGFISLLTALSLRAETNCSDEEHYQEISLHDLEKSIAKKSVFLLDGNGKRTYQKQHIPTAIHFETEKENLHKLLPKNKSTLVVAYCGGPMCSAWKSAAEEACKQGYTNIKHFKGGIQGWQKAHPKG